MRYETKSGMTGSPWVLNPGENLSVGKPLGPAWRHGNLQEVPMQTAGQGGGTPAPGSEIDAYYLSRRSETNAEGGGQTPQEVSEPSSLVPGF